VVVGGKEGGRRKICVRTQNDLKLQSPQRGLGSLAMPDGRLNLRLDQENRDLHRRSQGKLLTTDSSGTDREGVAE